MIRCAFDTNALLRALLFSRSVPRQALLWALQHGVILMSITLSEELGDVLGRPRFDRYLSRQERDEFLRALLDESELVEIVEPIRICRDPKDDKILELAVSGNAAYIVTGDADLLALNPFRAIAIISPAEFLRVNRP